jgi:hypothetical protein
MQMQAGLGNCRGAEITSQPLAVIAWLDRAIRYSETVVIEPRGRGVLDAPVKARSSRGMTSVCGATILPGRAEHLACPNRCQALFVKIIPFTRNSEYHILHPSRPEERGDRQVVTNVGRGSGGRGGVGARHHGQGGRRIEPKPVSAWFRVTNGADGSSRRHFDGWVHTAIEPCGENRTPRTAKPCGPDRRCYGQALRRCSELNRVNCAVNSRGDGDKNEFVAEESTA